MKLPRREFLHLIAGAVTLPMSHGTGANLPNASRANHRAVRAGRAG
jgi:hypothetical protein